jgi:hypothetical protein
MSTVTGRWQIQLFHHANTGFSCCHWNTESAILAVLQLHLELLLPPKQDIQPIRNYEKDGKQIQSGKLEVERLMSTLAASRGKEDL